MATYKIDFLNNSADIVNPVVTFPQLLSWDVSTKIGTVLAVLTITDGIFAVEVLVDLPTVNAGTISAKGQLKLDELYKV